MKESGYWLQSLREGIKDHVFRGLDPYQMAVALDGTINAFSFQMMKDPARLLEQDDVSTATEIFFKGVLDKQ